MFEVVKFNLKESILFFMFFMLVVMELEDVLFKEEIRIYFNLVFNVILNLEEYVGNVVVVNYFFGVFLEDFDFK